LNGLRNPRIPNNFGGTDGGRDTTGIKLAKTLAANKNTIERLCFDRTDLMGCRSNVDDWYKAFDKITSLKELRCYEMRDYINDADESTLDKKNSTVE